MTTISPFWQQIVDQGYALPSGYALEDLTESLLQALANPDETTRVTFGYSILAHWVGQRIYPQEALGYLIKALLKNLLRDLGDQDTDTVFLRSYSALLLATIIALDNEQKFLKTHQVVEVMAKAIDYMADEKDLRAYVEGKGWAHSAAHTADLCYALAQNRHLDANYLTHLLYALADKAKRKTGVIFIHEEEDRLARACLAIMGRPAVTPTIRQGWLTRLEDVFDMLAYQETDYDPLIHSAYINSKNILRSAYLQLQFGPPDFHDRAALLTQLANTLGLFPQE